MSDFETFLRWEEKSRDTIDFKKAYVDMAGDVIAGLLLSQIVYWYLPGAAGQTKLRVEKDGKRWLVKSREEWWEECRLTPREVDRARKVLEGNGLIQVRLYKFNGSPTQHIRIQETEFVKAWQAVVQGGTPKERNRLTGGGLAGGPGEETVPPGLEAVGKCQRPAVKDMAGLSTNPLKFPFSPNGEIHFTDSLNAFHQNGKMDFTKRLKPKTETTTEITTTASAAEESTNSKAAAAVLLTNELISHGVGRRVAERLAREKPGVCRRCLEYLPYAQVRTTKGAWLASAIREEYGPPPGYLDARHREEREERLHRATEAEKRRISHRDARRRQKEAGLRERLSQVEKVQGNAWAAFTAYLAKERGKVLKMCGNLTPERCRLVLDALETEARRLEIFACWLERTEGRCVTAGENGRAGPGLGPALRVSSCAPP
jgi:hypothetical protein